MVSTSRRLNADFIWLVYLHATKETKNYLDAETDHLWLRQLIHGHMMMDKVLGLPLWTSLAAWVYPFGL